jgi:hypothetical protein
MCVITSLFSLFWPGHFVESGDEKLAYTQQGHFRATQTNHILQKSKKFVCPLFKSPNVLNISLFDCIWDSIFFVVY